MEMLRNPVFWVYLSGAAAGCSLGYLYKRLSKEKSAGPGVILLLSISLLTMSFGVIYAPDFLSAPGRLLVPFIGTVIIGFFIGRFPRAAVPSVLLIFGLLYFLVYSRINSESGIPVHENPLMISVLRFTDTGSVLELSYQGKASLITLEGESFSLEAESLILSSYLPWPRREYLFAQRCVSDTGRTVQLPDLHKARKIALPPGPAVVMEKLGIVHKEVRKKGPLHVHLLRSYTVEGSFFGSEHGL